MVSLLKSVQNISSVSESQSSATALERLTAIGMSTNAGTSSETRRMSTRRANNRKLSRARGVNGGVGRGREDYNNYVEVKMEGKEGGREGGTKGGREGARREEGREGVRE